MLKINPDPQFTADVPISIPGGTVQLRITFKYKDAEQRKEFFDKAVPGIKWAELLDDVIVSWKGAELEYSTENLEKYIAVYPHFGTDIFEAYGRELTGAKRKN